MPKICRHLIEDIHFINNSIVPCSAILDINVVKENFIYIKKNFNGNISEKFENYLTITNAHIKKYIEGNVPEFCKNCNFCQPIEIDSFDKIDVFKKIIINHKTNCNAKCIYCNLAYRGIDFGFKQMNLRKSYDIRPVFEQLVQKNLINEETEINIFGGECTEYPEELEAIIDFGIKNNCKFLIETNGIIYNKKIDYLLNENAIELRISLDAGTKETFEKIKRVDKWEQVIENLENYSLASTDNPDSQIHLKYIICPDINDNIQELNTFFELLDKLGIDHSILGIDQYWIEKNQNKEIPLKLKQLINYYLTDSTYNHLVKNIDYAVLYQWYVNKASHLSIIDKIKLKQLK